MVSQFTREDLSKYTGERPVLSINNTGEMDTTHNTGHHPIVRAKWSRWVVSDSLRPHGLQPARLLCPLLSPGVCSNSCPLSQWCWLTISSFVAPFSFCLYSLRLCICSFKGKLFPSINPWGARPLTFLHDVKCVFLSSTGFHLCCGSAGMERGHRLTIILLPKSFHWGQIFEWIYFLLRHLFPHLHFT